MRAVVDKRFKSVLQRLLEIANIILSTVNAIKNAKGLAMSWKARLDIRNCIYENGRAFVGELKNDRPARLEAPKFQNEYSFVFKLKDLPINASDPGAVEETLKAINNDTKMIDTTPHGSQTIAKLIRVFNTLIPGVIGDLGSYNLEFEHAKAEAEAAAAAALEAERIKKELAVSMAEEAAAKEAEAAILAFDALAAKQASEKEATERPIEVVTPVAAVAGGKKEKGEKGKAGGAGK
ncbi:hypothetical protein BCR33DRAFT_851486 [Rhizoclosmatium globosum]|uniref:Uncharacterized protein n=1 Tax=Rhizoclosmatium globosum TaxID=329046 RepID=A0A1Y2C740_9FUNG|nr:hypothetical protein BCR33DRAFT_851486 [Rhizoclosmatium globosum]|eukprot:ORY42851.1 hypothetical protein BCR33DRAFT_851486 [Rhizoclosmatium globosum]